VREEGKGQEEPKNGGMCKLLFLQMVIIIIKQLDSNTLKV
jgi:hypothetical protein